VPNNYQHNRWNDDWNDNGDVNVDCRNYFDVYSRARDNDSRADDCSANRMLRLCSWRWWVLHRRV
jgi:hypothetical protein